MAIKFYYTFKELQDSKTCHSNDRFYIAKDYYKRNGEIGKKYAHLYSHLDFNIMMVFDLSKDEQNFYEVINTPYRKFFYDIDIDILKNPLLINCFNNDYVYNLIDNLVQKTVELFSFLDIEFLFDPSTDVFICTSHGRHKYSLHIIFQYWTKGAEHSKLIYNKVMEHFPF